MTSNLKKERKKAKALNNVKRNFIGPVVTSKNRKELSIKFKEDYIKRVENQKNPDNLSSAEIERIASAYGNHEVKREQKHLKAFLKGASFYKYLGETIPVLTKQYLDMKSKMMQAKVDSEKKENVEDGTSV